MDLNEILVFVKVVQAGSFNKAAERLGMPNSTVSTKVTALERRLGTTLLHRTTRQLKLTQVGEVFFQNARKHIDGLESAENEATLIHGEPSGRLRITAPILLSIGVLPEIICTFAERYPKVKVEVVASDQFLDLIGENIDVAIRAGNLPDSTLKSLRMGTGYFAPYASPAYLKAHDKINEPKDLAKHICLQFSALNKDAWEFTRDGKSKVEVVMEQKFLSNELGLIKELALQSVGIALLPPYLCQRETKNKQLVRVLSEWKSETRDAHLVYPSKKFVSPKLSAFIEIASAILKKNLQLD